MKSDVGCLVQPASDYFLSSNLSINNGQNLDSTPPVTTVVGVDTADALRTLQVEPGAVWDDVRRQYRELLLINHPDHASDADAANRTDRIVAAFRVLRDHTADGIRPLPAPLPSHSPEPPPLVLYARPGDVFARLCQAAEHVGHVAYVDRDSNLIQVVIERQGWAASQLTAEITPSDDLSTVMFSLEPLGAGEAPPIADVVAELADRLRSPSRLDPSPRS